MKGKRRPRVGDAYALEDVQDIMKRNSRRRASRRRGKNDVTCAGKRGGEEQEEEGGEKRRAQQSWPRSLGKCGKTERRRKKKGGEDRRMEAASIYEGFVFPLKNNVSRNRGGATSPTTRNGISFVSLSRLRTNAPPKVITRRKTMYIASHPPTPIWKWLLEHVDRGITVAPPRRGKSSGDGKRRRIRAMGRGAERGAIEISRAIDR